MTDNTTSDTAALGVGPSEALDPNEAGPHASEADTAGAPKLPALPRPRIRFGAIAWGLIVCAFAYVVLTTVSDADARAGFIDWLFVVEPGELVLLGVLALGCFILLLALLGLIRRAQTAWGNRRR